MPFNCILAQGLLAHRALVPAIFGPEFSVDDHQPFVQVDEQKVQVTSDEAYPNFRELNPNSRELNPDFRELNLNRVDQLNRVEENEDEHVSGNPEKYLNK